MSSENKVHIIKKTKLNLNYCSAPKALTLKEGEKLSPLPTINFDGETIEFFPGETIMQAAERAGLTKKIPRFCYHPGLPIAGTCRMCTVEIEKNPKLQTACSTPAIEGMVIKSKNERVDKSHRGVMEFLLTNHPLDCPICDQAGECELQDYDFEYGPQDSRFKEEKRVFTDSTTRPLSNKIMLNMNRCVNCERCVRFEESITKTHDLLMLNRGWKKELTTADEVKGLSSNYQGCLADICPVGALTTSDFRFQKRVWFLEKKASICDGCSKGCNIEVHFEKNIIYRYIPLFNPRVNGHWMCDQGRFSYHQVTEKSRVTSTRIFNKESSTETTLSELKNLISSNSNIIVLIGTDATLEEAEALQQNFKSFSPNFIFYSFNGTCTTDEKEDHLLLMKDKTPNTKGLKSLGFSPYSNQKADLYIIFKNGHAIPPAVSESSKVITWGIWNESELLQYKSRLHFAGLATVEKSGSFMNCDDILQGFVPAINHQGQALSVEDIFSSLNKVQG